MKYKHIVHRTNFELDKTGCTVHPQTCTAVAVAKFTSSLLGEGIRARAWRFFAESEA